MLSRRNNSTIGTVIGVIVFAIAIIGTTYFDWTWENPEGNPVPLVIGGAAAVVAVFLVVQRIRS